MSSPIFGAASEVLVADAIKRGYHLSLKSPFSPGGQWHAGFTPHGVTGWNGRPDFAGAGDNAWMAIAAAYDKLPLNEEPADV